MALAKLRASVISFFLTVNLLAYFCTRTTASQEEFLNTRVQSAIPLLGYAEEMP